MNRMSWLLVVPLALASALSVPAGCVEFDTYFFDESSYVGGAGGNGGTGGGTGGGGTGGTQACTTQADCPTTECRITGSCNAGTCDYMTEIMPGMPVGAQVYGDCKQRECDASGAITQVDSSADVYVWAADSCRTNGCEAWKSPQPASGQCTTTWGAFGICDDSFNCIQCAKNEDCSGLQCDTSIGKCVPAHCLNDVLDADPDPAKSETDVDCGGPCVPCEIGMKCSVRPDCMGEGPCLGNPKTCQVPTCSDGFKNGDETGSDCGGSCAQDMANPKKCGQGQGCLFPDDCVAGLSCNSGTCEP
ncbi:hypothetical protein [Polyangium jinanense]|uniref:Tryptophan synthase alpha chain n=1 Tax=Polyangium jinanense TaxID=2829994 RepID=A0A9X3X5D7_9BACT|nr:hypothetical protein [Polyangium jinanense]MDC3957216.1 hypothetical protein [Polyangium jinanense]MDC3982618.1 hypothetical protein [Polyangium jinanense]